MSDIHIQHWTVLINNEGNPQAGIKIQWDHNFLILEVLRCIQASTAGNKAWKDAKENLHKAKD